jgi:hypothetical protein
MSQEGRADRQFGGFDAAQQNLDATRTADAPLIDLMRDDFDGFCESHIELASPAAIQRKQQMQQRLAFVQNVWNDAAQFEKVVISGRYLKLCNLTEWISDHDKRAWERVKSEILAARQKAGV